MLDRLRLIDGVSSVALLSSTKGAAGAAAGGSGSTSCPASYPVFNVEVVFDALPASTAKSVPPGSPVSATTTAKKPAGGS
jgi:hypothetical protein